MFKPNIMAIKFYKIKNITLNYFKVSLKIMTPVTLDNEEFVNCSCFKKSMILSPSDLEMKIDGICIDYPWPSSDIMTWEDF